MGLVFLEYQDARSAARAHAALEGRRFGANALRAEFYDPSAFDARELA